MRGECAFNNCICTEFQGKQTCDGCRHARCWHNKIYSHVNQFISPRVSARKPNYLSIFVPVAPPKKKILPPPNFCKSLDNLPA